jgi:hypothetical protein
MVPHALCHTPPPEEAARKFRHVCWDVDEEVYLCMQGGRLIEYKYSSEADSTS